MWMMTVDWVGVVPDLDIPVQVILLTTDSFFVSLSISLASGWWLCVCVCVSFVFCFVVVSFSFSFVIVVVVSEIESGSFVFFCFCFCRATGKRADGWGGRPDPFSLSFSLCCSALAAVVCLTCGASSINRDAGP